jgi:hypothetical protein
MMVIVVRVPLFTGISRIRGIVVPVPGLEGILPALFALRLLGLGIGLLAARLIPLLAAGMIIARYIVQGLRAALKIMVLSLLRAIRPVAIIYMTAFIPGSVIRQKRFLMIRTETV